MVRTFIATEVVENKYTFETTIEQEKKIAKIGYPAFLKELDPVDLVNNNLLEQTIGYVENVIPVIKVGK